MWNRYVLCAALLGSAWSSVGVFAQEASTRASATAATRPNPLADPVSAVKHVIQLIEREDYAALRHASFESGTVTELRERYAQPVWSVQNAYSITVLDSKIFDTVACVICKVSDGSDTNVFKIFVVNRYGDWKVEFHRQLNPRRLTQEERKNWVKANEWGVTRLPDLAPTTQPATAPASAPARQ